MTLKRVVLVLIVLALAGGGALYWRGNKEEESQGYVTAKVDRGRVAEIVTATGIINALATVQVGTYASGRIIAIDVDFNSPVHKGQRVAKIDPAPLQVKVQRAEANLANARASMRKAVADLNLKRLAIDRSRELRAKDFISQNDLDTAVSNHEQAKAQLALTEAQIQQAEADLRDARINLDYTDIISPVDGVVVSRNVDVGQTVAASFQTPTLFQIAQDLSEMQVITSVSESDIAGLRPDQPATFTVDAFPGRTFQGVVVQVRNAPVTVQNVVTYNVVINVDNHDLLLKPGMTATVAITTAAADSALRVPVRALGFDPTRKSGSGTPGPTATAASGEGVWRLTASGDVERVPVKLGLRDENFVEVTSGDLREGDDVAIALKKGRAKKEAAPLLGMPRMR